MFPLDPKTVERLARIICDPDGAYERKGWELAMLLKRAGWTNPPEYDGTPRIPWLQDCLEQRSDNRAEIERLICRVCDPLEYDDGLSTAKVFRDAINNALLPEQLVLSFVSGRPVLGKLGPDGSSAMFSAPTDLERRLSVLIEDKKVVALLVNRIMETTICETHGAYMFAIIGIGSFVEGLLLSVLTERDNDIRAHGFVDSKGNKIPEDRIGLHMLIDTAHRKDWIQLDAADFMHKVKEYRNFVHPRKQLVKEATFDRDSVMLCWGPVSAILNDLEERLIC